MYKTAILSAVIGLIFTVSNLARSAPIQVIVSPPDNFDPKDEIYMVGSFNTWSVDGEKAVKLKLDNGKLTTAINVAPGDLFFNFVKNKNWSHMPASLMGKSLCTIYEKIKPDQKVLTASIPAWKTDEPQKDPSSTITGNVKYISEFNMGPLNRKGDIAVYLPPSYEESGSKKYPVLYMLDGQNIFDEKLSYSDEWKVDETLESLIKAKKIPGIIVVAVPNGPRRWNEYMPWDFISWSGESQKGEGQFTMGFIRDELKPYIDKNFNTVSEARGTGLAGSSLGGAMAIYAALEHSDVFGFVGAFSPSLSINNAEGKNVLLEALRKSDTIENTKIYFDMGYSEYDSYDAVNELERLLVNKGVKAQDMMFVKDDIGRHCELDWAKRFPKAISWLLLPSK